MNIPTEFEEQCVCQCGCGYKTNRAKRNDKSKMWIKGNPLYRKGHNSKTERRHLTDRGAVVVPGNGHPNGRGKCFQIFEHTLVATSVLGRPLKKDEQIHHINGNPSDNRKENLVICESYGYHALLHSREKALRQCGNVKHRKCVRCKEYDSLDNLLNHGNGCHVHYKCREKHNREFKKENEEKIKKTRREYYLRTGR